MESWPIPSMYGIFAYIWLIFMVNVGKLYHTWMLWIWIICSCGWMSVEWLKHGTEREERKITTLQHPIPSHVSWYIYHLSIYPHEYRKNQANVSKMIYQSHGWYVIHNSHILKFQRQESHLWKWDATFPTHGWTETSHKWFELFPIGSMYDVFTHMKCWFFHGKFW